MIKPSRDSTSGIHRNAMRENFQHGGQREALSSISHAVFAPEHSIRQVSENERI